MIRRPFLHPRLPMKSAAVLASAVVLVPNPLLAIGAEDTTRPTPPSVPAYREKSVENETVTRGAQKAGEDDELLASLAGLVVAPTAASALDLQRRTTSGIAIEGFSDVDSAWIRAAIQPYLGQPVTLKVLNRLVAGFEREMRSRGRMLERVSFPPQEITSGVIALRLGPARAATVRLAGNPAFGAEFAAKAFRTKPGETIDDDTVLEDLDWLNENPLRRASISQTDGVDEDALDLALRLRSERAWRVYAGLDNQLSSDLGDERIYLGFQHGDLFAMDQRFTGQYTAALDFERLQGVSLMHEIPLAWRGLIDLSAGYTESESDVTGPLDQSGEFTRFAAAFRKQLPRWNSISQEWRLGFEFRDNNYLFTDGSESEVRFFQIETGWKGKRSDAYGTSRLDLSLSYNPGQGILGSDDEDYIALGADGAESLILRLDSERSLRLGDAGLLLGRMNAQWSDSDLLASDQITASGVNRVRGYDETVGYASNGIVASIEYQSPALHVPRAGDVLGVLFVDGAVLDRDAPTDPGELLSTGFGLRWRFNDHFSARADLGIPLEHPDDIDDSPMIHFALGTTW